jgi:hypothetical protein
MHFVALPAVFGLAASRPGPLSRTDALLLAAILLAYCVWLVQHSRHSHPRE